MFRSLDLDATLRAASATLRAYAGDDFAVGLDELRRAGAYVPIYLIRIEHGVPTRRLRPSPIPAAALDDTPLVPGISGFACAYQVRHEAVLLIAAPGPLETSWPGLGTHSPALGNPYDHGSPRRGKRAPW
ncbi:hypothetical protein [Deinococcus rufus]|uniref:Uncharacterized protein n=1 Tax=Deinococcus rufus TaxID=2136097 RepID=A0ABV7ZBI4_9DEIO